MIPDDLDPLEQHLLAAFETLEQPAGAPSPADPEAEALWRAQIESRHCDHAARWLQKEKRSFYSIGSAGHESNAAVALALRPTRSGAAALPLRRLLSRACRPGRPRRRSRRDAGRGRCDRRADRRRPPQGVRQPRAGRDPADLDDRVAPAPRDRGRDRDRPGAQARRRVRLARGRRRRVQLRRCLAEPRDRPGALNTTAHAAHQHLPVPLLFVCEDNGIGISVPSPAGWVANALSSRAALRYETADGDDPAAALAAARDLADWVRETRRRRAAPAHRSLPRPCRRRRRGRVPHARRRAGRPRARPAARHRRWLVAPVSAPAPSCRRLPRGESARPRRRARRSPAAPARERCGGDAAARARTPAEVAKVARADAAAAEPATEPLTLALAINGALAAALDAIPRCCSSARTSPRRAASTASPAASMHASAPAGCSTRCSTRPRSSVSRSALRSAGSCRCRRSSTWPTSTTPRTSCAARRRRCSSSRRASTATGSWCGSPVTATRRASAGTSTTTTRSPCCATFPAS